jgi:Ca-activated chloride channel family protein
MLSFTQPLWLTLFLLFPLYWLMRRSEILKRIEFPLTLGDWNGLTFKWSSPLSRAIRFLSGLSLIAALSCAIIALAGPVRFRQEPVFPAAETGIVFVLDVSPSMAARDVDGGTRIDAARKYIRAFVERRPGDAFGLVALGSEAALLVPPTTDHRVFLDRLGRLRIGEMGDGTALGMGLAVAAAHLVGHGTERSCVILLTDGENNTGEINPKTAAALLPERDIRLYLVGVGSRGEVPIEYTDPVSGKHYSGVLDSEYNEASLREIALRGKGAYVGASNPGSLETVFADIGEAVPGTGSSWTRTVEDPLEEPLLAFALALAALAWALHRLILGAIA